MGRWQETPAQNPGNKKMGVFTCDHDRKNIFKVFSREDRREKAMAKHFLDSECHGAT